MPFDFLCQSRKATCSLCLAAIFPLARRSVVGFLPTFKYVVNVGESRPVYLDHLLEGLPGNRVSLKHSPIKGRNECRDSLLVFPFELCFNRLAKRVSNLL